MMIELTLKMNTIIPSLSKSFAICFPVIDGNLTAFYVYFMSRFWDPIRRTTVQENVNIVNLEEICQGCWV